MRVKSALRLIPALALVLTMTRFGFAETASESMHQAGHSAANAISHAWQGTKTAVKDTDLTAKVKLALHNDKLTKGADIHVTTVDGVVTLRGYAPSDIIARAERVTRDTTGAVGVRNRMRTTSAQSER